MFTQYIDSEGTISFSGPVRTYKRLQPDVYTVQVDDFGRTHLVKKDIQMDGIVQLPGSAAENIIKKVTGFLTPDVRKAFEKYNMLYKRGLLLYGAPGTGKTVTIMQIAKAAIQKDMVVLFDAYPYYVPKIIENIRAIEGCKRPIMVIWEEFEKQIGDNEDDFLSLLDGVNQVDNVFYIAVTNYLDQIPERIKNRPSRFADVIEMGALSAQERKAFIKGKLHKNDKVNIDAWVKETDGLTVDHIKDMIISVQVLGLTLKEAKQKFKLLQEAE